MNPAGSLMVWRRLSLLCWLRFLELHFLGRCTSLNRWCFSFESRPYGTQKIPLPEPSMFWLFPSLWFHCNGCFWILLKRICCRFVARIRWFDRALIINLEMINHMSERHAFWYFYLFLSAVFLTWILLLNPLNSIDFQWAPM